MQRFIALDKELTLLLTLDLNPRALLCGSTKYERMHFPDVPDDSRSYLGKPTGFVAAAPLARESDGVKVAPGRSRECTIATSNGTLDDDQIPFSRA